VDVYDLDKIQTHTVVVRVLGKEFKIRPLTPAQFFEYMRAYSNFLALSQEEKISPEALRDGYFSVFSSAVEGLTKADVDRMSQQQAAVLFGIILDSVTGKAQDPEGLKKKPKLSPSAMSA
jgi:hypothetical protein